MAIKMFCLFSNSSSTHHQHYRLFQDIGAAVRDTAGRRAWRLCGWAESRSHRDLQRDKHHNNTQLTNRPTTSDYCGALRCLWLLPPMASFPLESSLTVSNRCSRIFSGVPDMTVYLNKRGRHKNRSVLNWSKSPVCPFCFFTCVFWVSAW